jgi:uncharacterized membrane-anchored protein YitT (DUF2179 family)
MISKTTVKTVAFDVIYAICAGIVVGTAYHFFQNSNGFAPGGVGGLATIIHHLLADRVSWAVLMLAFNIPIFVLVSAFIDKKLGIVLSVYLITQSFIPNLYTLIGLKPYSLINNGEDFNLIFAALATGVISGFGFSMMLRRFGASGGTYGISALIKKAHPEMNIAYVSFIMDTLVVLVAFFVYGMRITPVICTLINLFIASVIVDKGLSGLKSGYKFEIITDKPEIISEELMTTLKHGVTEIRVHGMYSDSDKFMLVCIINKRQLGDMMRIIKKYPGTFASFGMVNEVFGNFKKINKKGKEEHI